MPILKNDKILTKIFKGAALIQKVFFGETEVLFGGLPLLNNFTAAAAYSLRKLRAEQTNCIQIRRDSDNEKTIIGFTGNDLDETAIITFCGSANGFLVIWYDATTNALDIIQSEFANQPKIYDGVTGIVKENGKPALAFDGANDFLEVATPPFSQPNTLFAVGKLSDPFSLVTKILFDGSAGRNALYWTWRTQTFTTFAGGALYSDISNSNQNLFTALYKGPDSQLKINSITKNGNAGGNLSRNFVIGASGNRSLHWVGTIQEIIFFNSDQSSNQVQIENEINNFYSIF